MRNHPLATTAVTAGRPGRRRQCLLGYHRQGEGNAGVPTAGDRLRGGQADPDLPAVASSTSGTAAMSRPSSKALRYKEEGCDAFKFRCGTDWEHSDIFNDPLTVSDGVMALSERPGFGMELIDDVEREVPLRTGWVQSAQPPSIALKSDERPTSPRSTSQSSRPPGRSRGLRPCLAIERISVAGGQAVTGPSDVRAVLSGTTPASQR